MFYYGLIFGGGKCLHATSQKQALLHAISLAVNYRLFSQCDVSYRSNGKNDNVVLESKIRFNVLLKYAVALSSKMCTLRVGSKRIVSGFFSG